VGQGVEKFRPAHAPEGITVRYQLRNRSDLLEAELLAVRDTGLVVVRQGAVGLLRYRDTNRISFVGIKPSSHGGAPFSESASREIALVSRFPQGISSDLETRLLAAYGQSSMTLIVP
jgi:hypothetical protein